MMGFVRSSVRSLLPELLTGGTFFAVSGTLSEGFEYLYEALGIGT